MRAIYRVLIASCALALGGCWQSDVDLYAGETPVTPFKPGPIQVTSAGDSDVSHQQLTLAGTAYRVSGGKDETIMVVRFHPLPGAPGYLVADVTSLGLCSGKSCESGPHSYAVVHPLADGRVEELAQNCDDNRGSKIGATQKAFVCEFTDRAALEKALRTLLTEKPTAIVSPE